MNILSIIADDVSNNHRYELKLCILSLMHLHVSPYPNTVNMVKGEVSTRITWAVFDIAKYVT